MIRKSETLDALHPALAGHPDAPSAEYVRAFTASMPRHYRGFEPGTVLAHAAIAYERDSARVRIGIWRRLTGGGVAICVAAVDAPGLLSLVAAALTSHDLDIIAAQIYTRELPNGQREAVDLFWLRRRPLARSRREITSEEMGAVESLLADLIAGDELASRLVRGTIVEVPYSAPGMTSVRFEEDEDDAAVLVVQSFDRPGLLLTISRCLFCLGRVLDKFYLIGFDGHTIRERAKANIEAEVLAAIENLGKAPS
jgi:UTP:GlnB (protein PII) uridylyltransferase